MRPLNLDNSPCTPTSSNCVIWSGPDLDCIKLCTGDTISDVVAKLATELCAVLDTLNVSNYDLACLNLNTCAPSDFEQLIQLLIDKVCALENAPVDPTNPPSTGCPTDCIVAVADCLGGGTDTLINYVQTIANRVCSIVSEIDVINSSIDVINITLLDLQEQINDFPVYELPTVTSTCTIDGITTGRLDIMFNALLTDWCALIAATGTPSEIAGSITPACTLSGSSYFTDIPSEIGWITPITTLAESINNIWVSLCFFYNFNYAQSVVTGSDGVTVVSSYDSGTNITTYDVSLTTPLSTLMPIGAVLPWAGTSGTPPAGWLFCNGALYDGTDPVYNPLFTVIGTAYNPAVPAGSFRVPDMASSIPVGIGPNVDGYDLTAVGGSGGNRVETLIDAQIPTHTHDLSSGTLSGTTGSAGTHRHGIWADNNNTAGSGAITLTSDTGSDYDTTTQTGAGGNGAYISDAGAHTHSLSGTLSGTTGDGSPALQGLPHGNMQPYIVMQYIIKY
jgi:microcystin-dependent protein